MSSPAQSIPLPTAFVKAVQDLLGRETSAFLDSLEQPPPVSIHVNPAKPGVSDAVSNDAVPWSLYGFYLPERPSFTLDPAFHAGAYYVQEASSMLVAAAFQQLFPEDRPLRVLDLCAAPGGKSTLLASLLPEGSWLLSNELVPARYQILRYNLAKWGHPHTMTSRHDSRDFLPLAGFFDFVLVDAPCSGEGLFRKDMQARAEWSEQHVQACAYRQQHLLETAAQLVAPGGALLYSTCTYNHYENDQNARWLAENTGLEPAPLQMPTQWGLEDRSPGWQAYPHRLRGEGFYLAAFRNAQTGISTLKTIKPDKNLGKLRIAAKNETSWLSSWFKSEFDIAYLEGKQDNWRAIRADFVDDAKRLASVLNQLEVGTPIGQRKGKDLVPSAELALSWLLNPAFPALALQKEAALDYLRRQTPPLPNIPSGWNLIQYQNHKLGWIKGVGNRYNNYYPQGWVIRKG